MSIQDDGLAAFDGEGVARKAAAEIPAFVRMEREGVLDVLTSQLQAAHQLSPLIQKAVFAGVA